MGRDTITLEQAVSTISQEYLQLFCSDYFIPESLHPELPGPEDAIVNFPEGKIGVYCKFFEFANYRIPITQFLFDLLGYYQIHLSQLSVIGTAKVSQFEINCRVLNVIPTVDLFRVFYIPTHQSGWMSFAKRPGKDTPQCYVKSLDSLKNWNNRFFWVDERVFPTPMAWRSSAPRDKKPTADNYFEADVATLNTHRTSFGQQHEDLLCLVGISQNYFFPEDQYPVFLYDNDQVMDLFGLIKNPNPKVKVGTRPRAAHEVPLLQATASRVVNMEETPTISTSTGTPSAMEKSPLDFADEDHPAAESAATEVPPETNLEQEVLTMGPPVNKRRRKRDRGEDGASAPSKVPRTEQGTAADTQSVSEPETLSFAVPWPTLEPDVAQSSKAAAAEDEDTDKSSSFISMGEMCHMPSEDFLSQYNINMARQVALGSQLRLRFEQESKLLKKAVAKISHREQKIKVQDDKIRNLESLIEAKSDMKRVAKTKNEMLTKELEDLHTYFSKLQVDKMDARLDALSIDFDEELYPHMLTEIAGHRWMIRHGLRLAVMKDGVEHRKAGLDVASLEGHDPEADEKFTAALQALKELKYPLIDELEQLKDAPIDCIMGSLYLDSDTGEDAPPEVHNLCPCTSQLRIPIYPEVRDPRNPWVVRKKILLEDAIAANISRAEKKKKSRVVCRTHGVGSAHHARSDGVPVSVPVVPQGLQIVLTDTSTQTGLDKDNSPRRLTRASSVPLF
ncbi:hypothetical protein Tco_0000566 [Tanacetum coccineum]